MPAAVRIQNDLDATLFTYPWAYADSFQRTVAPGTNFGTADRGGVYTPYTTVLGTGLQVAAGVGYGAITPNAAPKTYHQSLDSLPAMADTMVKALCGFSTTAVGGLQEASVYARSDVGADNYYRADLQVKNTDGHLWVWISKNTVGAPTTIGTGADMGAYTGGELWWIELLCVGSAIECRAWPADGTRPSTATCTGTDASFSGGTVGLRGRVGPGNTNLPEIRFYHALAYELPVAPGVLSNTAEGGSNGVTVTAGVGGNSGGASGDYFDVVQASGGAIFSTTHAAHGSLAYWPQSTPAYFEFNRFGSLSDGYARTYVYTDSATTAARNVISGAAGGTSVWIVKLDQTQHIVITDGAGAVKATSTATISLNSWFRLEVHHNSSAQLVVRLYNSMDSATITETLTASSGTASVVEKIRYQAMEPGGAMIWHDDVVAGATSWPGPAITGVDYPDSGTISLLVTPSATELYAHETTDAATVGLALTPSGTEFKEILDAATVAIAVVPSAVEFPAKDYTDTNTVVVGLVPSGTEFQGRTLVDTASVGLVVTPSAAEVREINDQGTVGVAITPSVVDLHEITEVPATVGLAITPSALEVKAKDYIESATVGLAITPSGTDVVERATVDAATVGVALTPSGTDTRESTDASILSVKVSPTGVEALGAADAATVAVALTPTGLDISQSADTATVAVSLGVSAIEIAAQGDVATVGVVVTVTGSDVPVYAELPTATVTITPSALETRERTDLATALVTITPALVTELREQFDVVTVPVAITVSGTDQSQFGDSGLVSLKATVTGADALVAVDSATVPLKLTPVTVDESMAKTDAATVPVALTPASADILERVDANTVNVKLTPVALGEAQAAADTGTPVVTITPSSTDVVAKVWLDAATALVTITPSTVSEALTKTDAATVQVTLIPAAAEGIGVTAISFVITPFGTDTRLYEEFQLLVVSLTPSAFESGLSLTTFTQVPFRVIPSMVEIYEIVEAVLVPVRITPRAVQEVYTPADYLLVGTLIQKWSGQVEDRLLVATVEVAQYTAELEERIHAGRYRGRGDE